MTRRVCVFSICLSLISTLALGQDADEAATPPEILTSDLAIRQVVRSDRLTVHFVIVDSDEIREVRINGVRQRFTPGDTVLITKEFRFNEGRQLIEIEATDQRGNKQEKAYLVLFKVEEEKPEAELKIRATAEIRYEIDDNPTNDLSSPIPIAGLTLEGAVPDDEQSDSRSFLKGSLILSYGNINGFAGAQIITYGKADNDVLNAQVFFIGGVYTVDIGENRTIPLMATFTDVNIGGNDYAVIGTLSPGYVVKDTTDDGDSDRTLYGIDLIIKDFADSDRDDVTQVTVKYDLNSIDEDKLDKSRALLTAGNSSEGKEETEYSFAGMDLDWKLKWNSGLRWDIGGGYQYRSYPNDDPLTDEFLGSTRIDNLIRFSGGLGWEFNPDWTAMFNIRYLTDISNKSPYVRTIYGLVVNGAF